MYVESLSYQESNNDEFYNNEAYFSSGVALIATSSSFRFIKSKFRENYS